MPRSIYLAKPTGRCHSPNRTVTPHFVRCRLEEAKAALDKALGSRELFGAPLLIAANKQDVEHALPATEVSSERWALHRAYS